MPSEPRRSCKGETRVIKSQLKFRHTVHVTLPLTIEDDWGKIKSNDMQEQVLGKLRGSRRGIQYFLTLSRVLKESISVTALGFLGRGSEFLRMSVTMVVTIRIK